MSFHVKVYCKGCHREGLMHLYARFTKDEIEHLGKCMHCSKKGQLRFISSK